MKTIRTVIRAFVLGTIAGLLIAPRAGRETRRILQDRFNNLLDSASGMDFDTTGTDSGISTATMGTQTTGVSGTAGSASPPVL